MKWLADVLLFVFRSLVYREAARGMRRKGIIVYLKTLQLLRQAFAGSLLFYFVIQLFFVGFIGSIVIGTLLLPQELNTKLWILLSVFGLFFIVPLALLLFAFSEKVWFQMSGAGKMLAEDEKESPLF